MQAQLLTPTTRRCACGQVISGNKLACAAHAKPVPIGDGVLEILNVGAGDVKLTFNTGDPSDVIRCRRIVSDMLRRGFALLVEVERDGEKRYERAQAFDETTGEYLIADFDPLAAHESDLQETAERLARLKEHREQESAPAGSDDRTASGSTNQTLPPGAGSDNLGITVKESPTCQCGRPLHHRGACKGKKYKRVPMQGARATAVGRSAGG